MNSTERWLRITVLNLLIVAILGVLMRYKIGFSFPYFDQKHLQHAHANFAFCGWITQTLYVLMLDYLAKQGIEQSKQFGGLLLFNMIAAYGMLFSFLLSGYSLFSAGFSMLALAMAILFTWAYIHELKKIPGENQSKSWFIAALLFSLLSSIGTMAMTYMMITRQINQDYYLATLYFYLHFQYNGFFLFTCFGLIISVLPKQIRHSPKMKAVFRLFAFACVPAYLLSILWTKLPWGLYTMAILAAIFQMIGWLVFLKLTFPVRTSLTGYLGKTAQWFFTLVAIAFSVKLILQLGSTIPAISKLAFGFRNIVIAYLHLTLLAVITVFLLTFIFNFIYQPTNKLYLYGLWMFVAGVYLNEIILGIIGIASFSYTVIPFGNALLLSVSICMLLGLLVLFIGVQKKSNHLRGAL